MAKAKNQRSTSDEDIVHRALRLIKPKPEQRALCAAAIKQRIERLQRHRAVIIEPPSPGDAKKQFAEIGRDLQRAREIFANKNYSELCKSMLWGDHLKKQKTFLVLLDQLIHAARHFHDTLVIPPGRPPRDGVKAAAVGHADELLRLFSNKCPTKTLRGPFYRLASLLYMGATGEEDVSLARHCRGHLDNPNRVDPNIIWLRGLSAKPLTKTPKNYRRSPPAPVTNDT
jgi:hypothetical protein